MNLILQPDENFLTVFETRRTYLEAQILSIYENFALHYSPIFGKKTVYDLQKDCKEKSFKYVNRRYFDSEFGKLYSNFLQFDETDIDKYKKYITEWKFIDKNYPILINAFKLNAALHITPEEAESFCNILNKQT